MRSSRFALLAALLASPVAMTGAAAQTPSAAAAPVDDRASVALDPGEGRLVAQKLADELLKSFVFHEQAEAYAATLRSNAAAGKYDSGTRGALAEMLTDDMQAVHKDGHLHVELARQDDSGASGGKSGPPPGMPPLIQSARTIAPGIGYIRFTAFTGRDEEMAGVRKWLAENRDDKVLIFDLRNHHGGGLAEQDAIFSYCSRSRRRW
jgi:hypothetical protein